MLRFCDISPETLVSAVSGNHGVQPDIESGPQGCTRSKMEPAYRMMHDYRESEVAYGHALEGK